MKILFLAHSFPWPLHEGVRLHVYHLLKELSRHHEMHLLCFIESDKEKHHIPHLSPYCRSIQTVKHSVPRQPWRRLWNIVGQSDPYSVHQFSSMEMYTAVTNRLSLLKPDVLHVDFTVMAPYAALADGIPKVFFPHDAMSMLFERNIAHEQTFLRKIYMASQSLKMARYESKVIPEFDRTVVVSPVDKSLLEKRAPGAVVEWIPNGVDSDFYSPRDRTAEAPMILFRGIMSFLPNSDAALFAIREILPRIWEKKPQTIFSIIGANPPSSLRRLADHDPRIRLSGYVEDLRIPTAEASVVLCPMRIGSGIKNKILESMAMAKAIVATPMSLAGIEARTEVHLLTGDTAESLALQTLRLLNNPSERHRLGQSAREFVLQHHTWSAHAARFSEVYEAARETRKGEHHVS